MNNFVIELIKKVIEREIENQLVRRLEPDDYYNFKFEDDFILIKDQNNRYHKIFQHIHNNNSYLCINYAGSDIELEYVRNTLFNSEFGRYIDSNHKDDDYVRLLSTFKYYIKLNVSQGIRQKTLEKIKDLF